MNLFRKHLFFFFGFVSLFVFCLACLDTSSPSTGLQTSELTTQQWETIKKNFLAGEPKPRFSSKGSFSEDNVKTVEMLGMDVSPFPLQRGKKAKITFYMKGLRKTQDIWGVFVHIQDQKRSNYRLNSDHHPIKGLYHSKRWISNQIFQDTFEVEIPITFPSKAAHFYMGFWKGGQRLQLSKGSLSDGKNRLLVAEIPVGGKGLEKPLFVVPKTKTPPIVDGKLDDAIWKLAPSTGVLRTFNNRKARLKTEVKMVWDDQFLYVAFDLEDHDIYSTYTKRDDPLFKQENVEFFIDANRNHKDYIELQVSPAGVIFDSFFEKYRFPRPWGRLSYDSGMEVKVHVDGTVNNHKDTDKGWTVEMKLPFSRLGPMHNHPPKNGDEWLINLYRLERDKRKSMQWEDHAWSPVTLGNAGDYHNVSRFGTLRFSTQEINAPQKRSVHQKSVSNQPVLQPNVKTIQPPKVKINYKSSKTSVHQLVVTPTARLAFPQTIPKRFLAAPTTQKNKKK